MWHHRSRQKRHIASLLMKHGIKVVVFDPTQDWMKRSSIPNAETITHEFPKLYGKLYPPQLSIVYDISHLTIEKQQQLVEAFCKTLMQIQAETPEDDRQQFFLIFEEAHTYFPEGCMRAKRYRETVKMMTQGRNFNVKNVIIPFFFHDSRNIITTMRTFNQDTIPQSK